MKLAIASLVSESFFEIMYEKLRKHYKMYFLKNVIHNKSMVYNRIRMELSILEKELEELHLLKLNRYEIV